MDQTGNKGGGFYYDDDGNLCVYIDGMCCAVYSSLMLCSTYILAHFDIFIRTSLEKDKELLESYFKRVIDYNEYEISDIKSYAFEDEPDFDIHEQLNHEWKAIAEWMKDMFGFDGNFNTFTVVSGYKTDIDGNYVPEYRDFTIDQFINNVDEQYKNMIVTNLSFDMKYNWDVQYNISIYNKKFGPKWT
jgi:hypothetical protein